MRSVDGTAHEICTTKTNDDDDDDDADGSPCPITLKHLGDGSYGEVRMVKFDSMRLKSEKRERLRGSLERPVALKVMDKSTSRRKKMGCVTVRET